MEWLQKSKKETISALINQYQLWKQENHHIQPSTLHNSSLSSKPTWNSQFLNLGFFKASQYSQIMAKNHKNTTLLVFYHAKLAICNQSQPSKCISQCRTKCKLIERKKLHIYGNGGVQIPNFTLGSCSCVESRLETLQTLEKNSKNSLPLMEKPSWTLDWMEWIVDFSRSHEEFFLWCCSTSRSTRGPARGSCPRMVPTSWIPLAIFSTSWCFVWKLRCPQQFHLHG